MVYICKKGGKTVFYGHDTGGNLSPEAWSLITCEKFNLVSLDATMEVNSNPEYHMGLPGAGAIFEKLASLGCISGQMVKVIDHFSHNGHDHLTAWNAERGILASYDGMEVEL